MHALQRTWALVAMVLTAASTGCATEVDEDDDDFEEDVVEASSALNSSLPIAVRVKQGSGGRSVTRTFRYSYDRFEQPACGTGFSVKINARIGKVTNNSIRVNSVRVTFLPDNGSSVVTLWARVWSNASEGSGDNKLYVSGYALNRGFRYGESYVWDVNRTMKVAPKGDSVSIDIPVSGGLFSGDSSDFACAATATLQLLPR
jgi:hypothetical protein